MNMEELMSRINIKEPTFGNLELTSSEKEWVYEQMRRYVQVCDMLEELSCIADLEDSHNIEAAIVKYLAELDEKKQQEELYNLQAMYDNNKWEAELACGTDIMLRAFEEFEDSRKLIAEEV